VPTLRGRFRMWRKTLAVPWHRTRQATFLAQLTTAVGVSIILPLLPFHVQSLGPTTGAGAVSAGAGGNFRSMTPPSTICRSTCRIRETLDLSVQHVRVDGPQLEAGWAAGMT
jgi:hypothetical protein